MTEQQLVEKVARAIYGGRNGKGGLSWSLRNRAHREPYEGDARAAIPIVVAAMKEAGWTWPEEKA